MGTTCDAHRFERNETAKHHLKNECIYCRVEFLEDHVSLLQEENAYVNDMLDNAHNRSRLLELRLQPQEENDGSD